MKPFTINKDQYRLSRVFDDGLQYLKTYENGLTALLFIHGKNHRCLDVVEGFAEMEAVERGYVSRTRIGSNKQARVIKETG